MSPAATIQYDAGVSSENVEVVTPVCEYVPPDLVALYVTNNGSHQPSYVYRLLSEYYHPNDYAILDN